MWHRALKKSVCATRLHLLSPALWGAPRLRLLSAGARRNDWEAQRVALLIDGDNVPARLASAILEEIEEYVGGTQVDRRVYGDFSHVRNEAWRAAGMEHGLALVMQASAKGKNATDIALSIDAMDILHGGDRSAPVDTFVIVTNDGDFAPLAQRLRRSGRRVVHVGSRAAMLGSSCDAQVHVTFAQPDARSHQPHVETLKRALFEMTSERPGAPLSAHGDSPSAWVPLHAVATHLDDRMGAWRRERMAEFVNFKHMLESAPYSAVVEVQSAVRGTGRRPKVQARVRLQHER